MADQVRLPGARRAVHRDLVVEPSKGPRSRSLNSSVKGLTSKGCRCEESDISTCFVAPPTAGRGFFCDRGNMASPARWEAERGGARGIESGHGCAVLRYTATACLYTGRNPPHSSASGASHGHERSTTDSVSESDYTRQTESTRQTRICPIGDCRQARPSRAQP